MKHNNRPAVTYTASKSNDGPKVEFWLEESKMQDISPVPALNGGKGMSVAVVVLFLLKKEGKFFTVLSTERDHDFDNTPKKKSKLPAGMMEPGETWEQTIHRRITEETSLTPKKMKLCCVAKMSSTADEEDHYKACVVVTEVEGELNEESVDEVQNKKLLEIKFLRKNIIYTQQLLLGKFFAKVSHESPEIAFALMNN
jgi:ADP-ribose pyrophosphatase YjhB (NUDIX family)